jgi:CRP-like cAMP-binding protein
MLSSIFAVLRNIPALEGVDDSVLQRISSEGKTEKHQKDEFVFQQGDPGDLFYVIRSGKVSVIKKTEDNIEQTIAILYDDNFFGEMALLSNEPRNASIKCLEDCEVITFNKNDFLQLLQRHNP